MTCQQELRAQGKAYPRTCEECGLGPCKRPGLNVAPRPDEPEIPDDVVERAARAICRGISGSENRWHIYVMHARAAGRVFVEWERERMQATVDLRMNNRLCEMKPDYDDAITGFNEAWGIATAAIRSRKA